MQEDLGSSIIQHARQSGADLAGIADVERLKDSPSYRLTFIAGTKIDNVYATYGMETDSLPVLPEQAKSALVIALSHPQSSPELDWFYRSGNTTGNSRLIETTKLMSLWLKDALNIKSFNMPYYVEKGGTFLKDAAVLAGLGCLGKNNLLVTPEYGPRVRLRALLLEEYLKPTGPVAFDPCKDCAEYCRKACPQMAFSEAVCFPVYVDSEELPARDGYFRRSRCILQMDSDWSVMGASQQTVTDDGMDDSEMQRSADVVKHCRRCEFACPVGR
jgi:epoxyqueuosine reductase